MKIKKRSFVKYILLNCLTLGIYGAIVSHKMGEEINDLCKGDGEKPKFKYFGAVMFRGIASVCGILFGLVISLIYIGGGDSWLSYSLAFIGSEAEAAFVFIYMTISGVAITAVGSIISGIYRKYWWYKQANRLKLNANRYGIVVNESGVDNFILRTGMEIAFLPITVCLCTVSLLIPALLLLLACCTESIVFVSIVLFIIVSIVMFFGMELTTGSNFAMYYIIKNLNRFADASRNGAMPFDPMAYEYYPSVENKYIRFVPDVMNGKLSEQQVVYVDQKTTDIDDDAIPTGGAYNMPTGLLLGEKGSCAGYKFDLISGERIVIGKDAKVSQVVIDTVYKEISRKHVQVMYDAMSDKYSVTDFSSNGTWANGSKLIYGQEYNLPRGTTLKLANDKNIFRLG